MTVMRRIVRSTIPSIALVAATLPGAGCIFGSGPDEPQDEIVSPHSGEVVPAGPLDSCTAGLGRDEVADTVEITFDFEISAHEMVACGGLVFSIVGALVEGLVDLAENPDASTLPEGFRYDQGTYYIEPDGFQDLRMEVRFYLGRDYSFGQQGDLVVDNLFVMDSYLVNAVAEVTIDTSSGIPEISITITHDGPGPLVELLGLGADPPSPINVTQSMLEDAQAHLGDLQVEPIIFFTDHPGVSTIEYDVEARMAARSFLTGSPMNLDMVGADGVRQDLGQDLDIVAWTVEYDDGVGALRGEIDFTVRGGPFDFRADFTYDGSGWPLIELSCAE